MTPEESIICYEQPLNERMRTFLRYEALTQRFKTYSNKDTPSDSHIALMVLIEIISLVSRGDLKQELLKEIKRQLDTLDLLRSNSKLDASKLNQILSRHKAIFDQLHMLRGQLGSHLKENDFIGSIRQRAAIPGGTCDFDLPEYHHWLAQPFLERKKILMNWIEPFETVQLGVMHTLNLIRESTPYQTKMANKGFFDQNLDSSRPNQLLRIGVTKSDNYFPECSAGKHRFSIRFLIQDDPNVSPKQSKADIQFQLACCTF